MFTMNSHTINSHEYDENFYTQLNLEFQSNEQKNNKNKRPSMQQTQKKCSVVVVAVVLFTILSNCRANKTGGIFRWKTEVM